MKTIVASLLIVLTSACAYSDDVAIVTAQTGYILDDNGQVSVTVPTYETLTATARVGDYIRVRGPGVRGRIHEGQVHLLVEHWQTESHPVLLGILNSLKEVNATESFEDARALLTDAMDRTENFLGEDSPMYVILLSLYAVELMDAGKLDAADSLMIDLRKLIRQLDYEGTLVASEIFNISGLIELELDRQSAAKEHIGRALFISKTLLGDNHQDVAVLYHNRAQAADLSKDLQQAIRDRKAANAIYRKILPVSAIEHPRGLIDLAEIYLSVEQPLPAIAATTSALEYLRRDHLDRKVDLAVCHFYLGEAWQHRGQYPEAERWYSRIDTDLPRDASESDRAYMLTLQKETQHALGDMDFDRKSFRDALQHYLNAMDLSDKDNYQTLDGWSFVYVADALTELGETQKAQRFYKGAWLVFEKTDGPESEAALDARQLYVDAGGDIDERSMSISDIAMNESSEIDTPGPSGDSFPSNNLDPDSNLDLRFVRPGEGMLTTSINAAIMDGSTVLTRVPAGTRLWNLETRGDWHRVMVPGEERSAWIANESVTVEYETMARDYSQVINDRAQDGQAAGRLNEQLFTLVPQISEVTRTQGLTAAVPLQEKLVALLEEAVGTDHSLTVGARTQLASHYFDTRQFLKSRDVLEAAIPSLKQVHGDDHPVIAAHLGKLATLLQMIGDLPGRERCLSEAAQIARKRFGPQDPRVLNLNIVLATALADNGQLDRAAALYERVLAMNAGKYPDFNRTASFGLGSVRLMQRRTSEAIEILRRVEAMCQKAGESIRGFHGNVADALTIAHFISGDRQQAAVYAQQAVELLEANTSEATLLPAKSRLAVIQRDWKEFLRHAQALHDYAASSFGESSIRLAPPVTGLGTAFSQLGRYDEARQEFERARRIAQRHVVNVITDLSVSQQIAFLKITDNPMLYSALSLGLKVPDDQAIAAATATWLLNSKNIANELAARDIQARRLCTADSHIADYEQWLDSRRRLATLPPLSEEEAQDQHIRQTEERLTNLVNDAFERLPSTLKDFLDSRRTPWVTSDDVREDLADDEVLIDIVRLRRRAFDPDAEPTAERPRIYAAWIIPGNVAEPIRIVELGNADDLEQKLVRPYLDKVMSSAAKVREIGEDGALAEMSELNRGLSQSIWVPIAKHLPEGTTRLTLCPDGALWSIPWSGIEQPNRKLVIEDYVVRFVSSGRDLLHEEVQVADLQPPTIIADPAYDVAATEIENDFSRVPLRSLSLRLENVDASLLKEMLPNPVDPLKGTAEEAAAIEPLLNTYSGMKSDMFLRKQASETALRLTRRPHTLFVGTHGFFWEEEDLPESIGSLNQRVALPDSPESNQRLNPLRRCGLLLAGCSTLPTSSDSEEMDGIVTGSEIVGLDLRGTKLVVMSACETGVGELTSGQGVAGLRQAMQLAGAESVVSTLWMIPDSETKHLMTAYFNYLAAGESRAAALRMAQLDRIHARRDRNGAAHPFFWAAFTVTGRD